LNLGLSQYGSSHAYDQRNHQTNTTEFHLVLLAGAVKPRRGRLET
jgi:hypothetical protein